MPPHRHRHIVNGENRMLWWALIINGCILVVSITSLYITLSPENRAYYGSWAVKLIMYAIRFTVLVFIMKKVAFGIHCFRNKFEHKLGPFLFVLMITCIFALWLAIVPSGIAPTMLAGVIWADKIWIGIIVSYISVNMGSFLSLLWIRYLIIGRECVENSKCIYWTFMFLGIDKIRKWKFITKLLKAWDPIKILIIFRVPFFMSGVTNYLFSFQPELISAKQYAIGNAIGFIPGSISFCMFGNQLMKYYKLFSSEKTWQAGIKKHPKEFIIFMSVVLALFTFCLCAWLYIQNIIKKSEEDKPANETNETTGTNSEENENEDEEKDDDKS